MVVLALPDNVYLIGTVNMDETTHPFSKKVLDRANTIEFNYINLEQFPVRISQRRLPRACIQYILTKRVLATNRRLHRQSAACAEDHDEVGQSQRHTGADPFACRLPDQGHRLFLYDLQ